MKRTARTTSPGFIRRYGLALILVVLSAGIYLNTIPNDYALDDIYSVTRNAYTRQGLDGIPELLGKHYFAGYLGEQEVDLSGGRYRPLSLVTFAIEYELLGENPHLSHFLNMILYALLVLVMFSAFRRMFPQGGQKWWEYAVFTGMLLYAAHPVHTEVVANIKGRDELLAALFGFLALRQALISSAGLRWKSAAGIVLLLFLALMSKENAAVFVVLIPLALYWTGIRKARPLISYTALLFLPFLVFFLIRWAVLGTLDPGSSMELMDNPFLHASLNERYGTILRSFGDYYRLMLYPAVLTWDYYPYHIPLTGLLTYHALVPLAITLALLILAVKGIKERSIASFGLLFFFISFFPLSNIPVNLGAFMAERFLFLPSAGLCLALGALLSWLAVKLTEGKKALVPAILLLTIAFFVYRTYERNKVWKDDFTLYTHDVLISANSAKSNNIAAKFYAYEARNATNASIKQEYYDQALTLFRRAVEIHPAFMDAWFHYGNTWYEVRNQLDSTLYCYGKVLSLDVEEPNVWNNLYRLADAGTLDDRRKVRMMILEYRPADKASLDALGRMYLSEGRLDEALPLFRELTRSDTLNVQAWDYLGVIHYQRGSFDSSAIAFARAYALAPEMPRNRDNLYSALLRLGRVEEARALMKQ